MVMNFVSYKLCILFVCLMCFQMFFVCIYHFPQFTSFLLGPFKSVKEGFYCIYTETSIHHSHMHYFHASIIHFLWSLNIAHINNFPATIVFPHSLFYFSHSLRKWWLEVLM
jgi:hypothetical protein